MSGYKYEDGTRDTASYMEVLQQAKHVSKLLYERKVVQSTIEKQGPKLVAHLNVPGWEYVSTQWGIWGAGYGSVPLAVSQKTPEMEHVLSDSDPEIIFVGGNCQLGSEQNTNNRTRIPSNTEELLKAAENTNMADRIVHLENVFHKDINYDTSTSEQKDDFWLGRSEVVPSLDEPALILYTSGTTGKPKGVLVTHRAIYHQVTDLVFAWEWDEVDVALHILPLHHVHGVINVLSCAAFVGARLDFQPFDAIELWKQWANYDSDGDGHAYHPKPNVFMAVPTIYAKLLEAADSLPAEIVARAVQQTLNPMRLMVSGSAALPISILEKWKKLTGHTLLERYGMTEFAMALSNPYHENGDDPAMIRRPGYVGRPLPSVNVRIVDEESEEIIKTPGVSGELQVKGPTVFQKYLNRPDATNEAFTKDAFFRTGDIAQYDANGIESYRILGRASVDIIKSGGYKMSALEIERALLEHPDIADVAVLGLPDDIWGERVGMICRLKPDAPPMTLGSLRTWCRDRLSKYKIPSRLQIVPEIPKNAMGKINKKVLANQFIDTDT